MIVQISRKNSFLIIFFSKKLLDLRKVLSKSKKINHGKNRLIPHFLF